MPAPGTRRGFAAPGVIMRHGVDPMIRTLLTCLAVAILPACADTRVDPNGRTDSSVDRGGDFDTGVPVGDSPDGAQSSDDSSMPDTATGPSDAASCTPNRDLMITRVETPVVVGATELFDVNGDGTTVSGVTTMGAVTASGIVWDLSGPRSDDHRVLEEVLAPTW